MFIQFLTQETSDAVPAPTEPPPVESPQVFDISQIPQVTIQNFQADPGFLSQPVATLIAGGFVLVGAVFAYAGVLRTARHAEKLTDKVRRLDALTSASEALAKACDSAATFIGDSNRREKFAKLVANVDGLFLVEARLSVLGLEKSRQAITKTIDSIMELDAEGLAASESKRSAAFDDIGALRVTGMNALKEEAPRTAAMHDRLSSGLRSLFLRHDRISQ